jgi:hypothetical protein
MKVGSSAIGAASTALTFMAAHPVVAGIAAITAVVGYLVAEFYKAHDAVTEFDDALKELGTRRTVKSADEIQAMITRYDQLAAKAKLSAEEQREASKIMIGLRAEFGDLKTGFTADGRIFGADDVRAQIGAARSGRSVAAHGNDIALAEAAFKTRQREGADAQELKDRSAAIAKMREDLARAQRIVADAQAPTAPTLAIAPPPPAKAPPAAAPAAAKPKATRSKFFESIGGMLQNGVSDALALAGNLPDLAVGAIGEIGDRFAGLGDLLSTSFDGAKNNLSSGGTFNAQAAFLSLQGGDRGEEKQLSKFDTMIRNLEEINRKANWKAV